MKRRDVVSKIKQVTKSAPPEVKASADVFIDALADFPEVDIPISEVNRVWNGDLPKQFRGKYDLN